MYVAIRSRCMKHDATSECVCTKFSTHTSTSRNLLNLVDFYSSTATKSTTAVDLGIVVSTRLDLDLQATKKVY